MPPLLVDIHTGKTPIYKINRVENVQGASRVPSTVEKMEHINKGGNKSKGRGIKREMNWICVCWIWPSDPWPNSLIVAGDTQLSGLCAEGDVSRSSVS